MSMTNNASRIKVVRRGSLRARLFLLILSLSLIPLVVISVLSVTQSQYTITDRINQDLRDKTELQSNMLQDFLTTQKDKLAILADIGDVKSMDPAIAANMMDKYFEQWKIYESLSLYALDGSTVYRTDHSSINVAERPYFLDALKK